jgi:hypothetical protein
MRKVEAGGQSDQRQPLEIDTKEGGAIVKGVGLNGFNFS